MLSLEDNDVCRWSYFFFLFALKFVFLKAKHQNGSVEPPLSETGCNISQQVCICFTVWSQTEAALFGCNMKTNPPCKRVHTCRHTCAPAVIWWQLVDFWWVMLSCLLVNTRRCNLMHADIQYQLWLLDWANMVFFVHVQVFVSFVSIAKA